MKHVAPEAILDAGMPLDHSLVDYIEIRGVRLDLDKLVNRAFFAPEKVEELRLQLKNAKPFPNIVMENLFNPKLLELIHDEFDLFRTKNWIQFDRANEKVHRSPPKPRLGPATQLYFDTINSGWFLDFISSITGVVNLIPDPHNFGGGLHETTNGGMFAVHADFNLHHKTALNNEMVFITYLNKDWKPEYNGALELWDADKRICAAEILPEFGHTALFIHGLNSLHGHSTPLNAPEGMSRRSVAAYYYSNRKANRDMAKRHSSVFFPNGKAKPWDMMKLFGQYICPTVVLKIVSDAKESVKRAMPESALAFFRRGRS